MAFQGTTTFHVSANTSVAAGSVSTSGNNTIVSIPADSKIRIYHISFVINPDATNHTVVTIKTGSTTKINWALNKNGSAVAISPINGYRHIEGADGEDLIINLNQSETVYYNILYDIIDINN